MTVTEREVLDAIRHGELDASLVGLKEAISARKLAQGMTLRIGDRVRFIGGTPRYIQNAEGIVRKVNQATCVVDLDTPIGRFYRGVRSPYSLVEKV